MFSEKDIELRPFTEEDIPTLTQIMKRAFDEDSWIHLGKKEGGPTGYDDGSLLRKLGFHKTAASFEVIVEKKIVGAVILQVNNEIKESIAELLFLNPSQQNKGLGIALWNKIEAMYPEIIVWRGETPSFSRRNHNFYVNKCGFHIIHIKKPMDLEEGSYILEKRKNIKQ